MYVYLVPLFFWFAWILSVWSRTLFRMRERILFGFCVCLSVCLRLNKLVWILNFESYYWTENVVTWRIKFFLLSHGLTWPQWSPITSDFSQQDWLKLTKAWITTYFSHQKSWNIYWLKNWKTSLVLSSPVGVYWSTTVVGQMLSWWTKKLFLLISISDITAKLVHLLSVYKAHQINLIQHC